MPLTPTTLLASWAYQMSLIHFFCACAAACSIGLSFRSFCTTPHCHAPSQVGDLFLRANYWAALTNADPTKPGQTPPRVYQFPFAVGAVGIFYNQQGEGQLERVVSCKDYESPCALYCRPIAVQFDAVHTTQSMPAA